MKKDKTQDPGIPPNPAIWIYSDVDLDVEISLRFAGGGFMTYSRPPYNDKWRVYVDSKQPFNRYSSTHADDAWVPYLDYDGFRDGDFQRAEGWLVEQSKLIEWQREYLPRLGFHTHEIDDVNTGYARMLLSRKYPEKYFAIYPQDTARVDQSVALEMTPPPVSRYRLWLYFVPTDDQPRLEAPRLQPVPRNGLTLVELAYLTDREIPATQSTREGKRSGMLANAAGQRVRAR